ncbi:MAG: hypothetical protein LBH92_08945, partial [Bacteroidales bacterium]|nr:hypothetical protein [Bacteroidales bacterium]
MSNFTCYVSMICIYALPIAEFELNPILAFLTLTLISPSIYIVLIISDLQKLRHHFGCRKEKLLILQH